MLTKVLTDQGDIGYSEDESIFSFYLGRVH